MPNKNKVNVLGHLGKEPDIRTLPGGDRVANFSIATSEKWKDRQSGEQKEKTEWHRCVCFIQPLMDFIQEWKKGDLVEVEGKLETRKWQDQSGMDKYTTEVVVRPFGGEVYWMRSANQSGPPQQGQASAPPPQPEPEQQDEPEDEIPF